MTPRQEEVAEGDGALRPARALPRRPSPAEPYTEPRPGPEDTVAWCEVLDDVVKEGPVELLPLRTSAEGRLEWSSDSLEAEILPGGRLRVRGGSIGDAVLLMPGFQPALVSWRSDETSVRCDPVELIRKATVRGTVSSNVPEGLWAEVCGTWGTVAEGSFTREAPAGACRVQVVRCDGWVAAVSDPIDLELAPGDDARVRASVPDGPLGGIGVRLAHDGEHVWVDESVEGGPAYMAGVEPGWVLLEIEGDPVPPDPIARARALSGPPGTKVTVRFEHDGRWIDRTIERAPIAAPNVTGGRPPCW